MNIETKTLIPNKEWILTSQNLKIGSIHKIKKGFNFFQKGKKIHLNNKDEIKKFLGIEIQENVFVDQQTENVPYVIYDYPCSSNPFNSIFDLKKKIALFSKSPKSKSKFCAGYFLIKFNKKWVKSFCPKLITIERYENKGPYKSKTEMKNTLVLLNKNETT